MGSASYPTEITQQSCPGSSGFIYCFGGDNNTAYTNSAYYSEVINLSARTTSSISTTTVMPSTTITSTLASTQTTTTTVTHPTTTTITSTRTSSTTVTSTITSVSNFTSTQTRTLTSAITTTSIQLVPTSTKLKCSLSTLHIDNSTTCTAKVTSKDSGQLPEKSVLLALEQKLLEPSLAGKLGTELHAPSSTRLPRAASKPSRRHILETNTIREA